MVSSPPWKKFLRVKPFMTGGFVREFFERRLLPIKLEKIDMLGFIDLRRYSMTINHQGFCQFVPIYPSFSLFSLMVDFVVADALRGYSDESVSLGIEGR